MRRLVKIHSAKVERCRTWVNKFSSCGEQTCDHVIIFFKPWSETNGPWSNTKFKPFERTSVINSIWQYRNIPINMEYCEEYLHLSSVKWNHFNGFLFGPCSSIWCIFTVWRVLQIIQLCVIREKNKEGKLHFKLAQKFPSLSFETTKASSVVKDFSRTIQL